MSSARKKVWKPKDLLILLVVLLVNVVIVGILVQSFLSTD